MCKPPWAYNSALSKDTPVLTPTEAKLDNPLHTSSSTLRCAGVAAAPTVSEEPKKREAAHL